MTHSTAVYFWHRGGNAPPNPKFFLARGCSLASPTGIFLICTAGGYALNHPLTQSVRLAPGVFASTINFEYISLQNSQIFPSRGFFTRVCWQLSFILDAIGKKNTTFPNSGIFTRRGGVEDDSSPYRAFWARGELFSEPLVNHRCIFPPGERSISLTTHSSHRVLFARGAYTLKHPLSHCVPLASGGVCTLVLFWWYFDGTKFTFPNSCIFTRGV